MSKQVIIRRAAIALNTSDTFLSFPVSSSGSTADIARTPFPSAGTLGKMYVVIDVLPAAGTTKVFTLVVNGSTTACVVTLDDTHLSGQYTGAPIAIGSGDYAYIAYTHTGTPGASAALSIAFEFTSTNANESVHCGGELTLTSTTPRWIEALNPNDFVNTTALIQSNCIVSAPGNITAMFFSIGAAAGTTGSYKATIYKNGTAQDGTSGTPDTRITIVNVITRVDSSAAFTLSVVAGDLLAIQIDGISTPSSKTGAIALRFQSTNAGESNLSFALPSYPSSGGGVNSYNTVRQGSLSWSTITARNSVVPSKFRLNNMQVYFTVAPGGVTSRTFIPINSGSNGNQSVTVTGASITGSDATNKDTYANAGDTFGVFESAVSGSPAASLGSIGFTMFIQGGNPPGKGQQGNKKSGGGGVNLQSPGGTGLLVIGNPGLDVTIN